MPGESSTPMSSRLAANNWSGETMRRRTLLITGLIALAGSMIGPAVQASISGDIGWWGGHMSRFGHMSWWGDPPPANSEIEGAPELVMTVTEYVFSPTELKVDFGESVNLTLKNTGEIPHDLVIPELGVHIAAGPGQQATTGIAPEKAGSFDFLCSYPGHAEAGMTGLLVVGPNQ